MVNPDGSIAQTLTPPALTGIVPLGHVARFLWQDVNNEALQFKGTMVLIEQSGTPFSVVALVLNQALYTAIPVIPANAPNIH